MPSSNPTTSAFMGTPLPRNAFHLISTPLSSTLPFSLHPNLHPAIRPPIRAITRKVSDIRAYPDLDKDVKRLARAREKRAAQKARREAKEVPSGYGDRPGIGFGPVGSAERTMKEREARHRHLEDIHGPSELHRRVTGMLDGGKADLLLHTLRARFLERMHKWALGEVIKLRRDIPFVYAKLVDEILLCDRLYYADNPKPRIRDEEYDELVLHLLELERLFPELIVPQSPSQNVGHGAAVKSSKLGLQNELSDEFVNAMASNFEAVPVSERLFPQYRHKSLMLSLDNAYKIEDLISIAKRAEEAGSKLSAELKIDGVALSLEYQRGIFFKAATRGTGRIGDEVTDNIRASLIGRGVVEQIPGHNVPNLIIVRGEVFINPQDFEDINHGLERKLSNPRNAAAGALKHKDPLEARERKLRFVAYECLTGDLNLFEQVDELEAKELGKNVATPPYPKLRDTFESQTELFKQLAEWGFGQMPKHAVCDTVVEAEAYADQIELERDNLSFQIDGVVFKFENSEARAAAGHTARAPRGAIAYKFTAQSKVTQLREVVMQVSRNGLITPVAVVEPVRVGGAMLSRATLHNFDEVKRLGIAVGDLVRIQRGGDVIPKIVAVEEKGSSPDRKPLEAPKECPSCQGEVIMKTDEVNGTTLVGCKNGANCHAQILGRLIHFSSKDALNINGLGKKTCDKLIKSGLVVALVDLFRLTLDDMAGLEGHGKKSARSMYDSVWEAASKTSLERLIFGLGFPGVGRTGARALAKEINSLERLLEVAKNESGKEVLLSIPNFAEKSVDVLFQYLQRDVVQSELKAMMKYVKPKTVVDEEELVPLVKEEMPQIAGKSFVFTGKLAIMSRPALKQWIKAAGGLVKTDVSHRTDYVVTGLDPGQKFFKAQRMKVKTLQEEEFLNLFELSEEDKKELLGGENKTK